MTTLISLSGLPGVGKTTLARALSNQTKAVHLRVDSVETAMKNSTLKIDPAEDAGYLVVALVAKDNLLLGHDVIVDTVNPIEITRKMWSQTALDGDAYLLNVEVICSNKALHRQRVENRQADIKGHVVPDWVAVKNRTFEPWQGDRLTVDTSTYSIQECASLVSAELAKLERSR